MNPMFLSSLLVLAAVWTTGCQSSAGYEIMRLFDLSSQEALSESRSVQQLQKVRIILVGEHHNNPRHHLAQLKIIQALHRAGSKVAVGLEMFPRQGQNELDQWVSGQLDETQFEPIYLNYWNFDWKLYRPIFEYARQNQIPMVGLNVPRKITIQVAYHGFASLNRDQKGSLEGITCNVTPEYREFVKGAHGIPSHGGMNFESFCEAQLVWDSAMAIHAIDFLERHPRYLMVILAGSGHAHKLGIPDQLNKQNHWPYMVVLPETKGVFDAEQLTVQDADYILMLE